MEKETYLTFKLGQEFFAVGVANVLEVLERQQITPVPRAPEHILGIINFRGNILPVVDTRQRFNLFDSEAHVNSILIVFEMESAENHFSIAATADGVKDVIEISQDEIKPIPEIGLKYDTHFIRGVIRRDENFILILDTEAVFSPSDTEVINN
ncbi:MAG TPA: chemotaxis protein CheW [Bacteroidales bacterium]|nr:chemotaxis protein CheW [Bacteroidales bacterium]